jgi:hypothetical protein
MVGTGLGAQTGSPAAADDAQYSLPSGVQPPSTGPKPPLVPQGTPVWTWVPPLPPLPSELEPPPTLAITAAVAARPPTVHQTH